MRTMVMLAFRINTEAIYELLGFSTTPKQRPLEVREPVIAKPMGVQSTALPNGEVHEHVNRTIEEGLHVSREYRTKTEAAEKKAASKKK